MLLGQPIFQGDLARLALARQLVNVGVLTAFFHLLYVPLDVGQLALGKDTGPTSSLAQVQSESEIGQRVDGI